MAIFASNDLVPATRVRINFGTGPSTVGAGQRRMLVVGPKLSTGTATVNTVYRINSEAEVETYAGAGSPLHQAVRGALTAWKKVPLYILPVAATSGGAEVAASAIIRLSGIATKAGRVDVTLSNTQFSVGFASGDGYAAIATNIAESINAITYAPAIGTAVTSDVTVTAKLAGISQSDNIRLRVSVTPGCGITAAVVDDDETLQDGADGSTTELANITTALSTISDERFYYLVSTNSAAATVFKTHIETKSEPDPGLRTIGFVGFVDDDPAAANVISLALNYERMNVIAQPSSEVTKEWLVGHWAGIRAKRELENRRYNFANYAQADWSVPRVYSSNDILTTSELAAGVSNGVTLVQSSEYGSYVVRSVTTASKNSTGTIDDFRKLDTHIVSVADEVGDVVSNRHANTFTNFALKADQYLDDGVTVNPLQRVPARTLTPSRYTQWLITELSSFNSAGQLDKFQDTVDSISSAIDGSVSSRLNVEFDLYVIPLLFQTGLTINEASSG
jgi:phage tail sheath gpL-like